jgi:hypothetical protein
MLHTLLFPRLSTEIDNDLQQLKLFSLLVSEAHPDLHLVSSFKRARA